MLLLYSFNLVLRDRSFDVKNLMCLPLWFYSACPSTLCINCWQLIPSVYSCQPENHQCKTPLSKPRTVLRTHLELPDPKEGVTTQMHVLSIMVLCVQHRSASIHEKPSSKTSRAMKRSFTCWEKYKTSVTLNYYIGQCHFNDVCAWMLISDLITWRQALMWIKNLPLKQQQAFHNGITICPNKMGHVLQTSDFSKIPTIFED
jgi:hypothetical protein